MKNDNANKEYIEIRDEAMSYLNYEALKSQLANISGVPDREYRVIDTNNVFVFSKFSNEVLENAIDKDAQALADLALQMLPSSYMKPSQAIKYGIRPYPYEVQEVKGGFQIKHKIFKSLIPGLFATKEELDEILVSLLIGNTHGSKGDFVYKGQPMVNEFQLDTKLSNLPIKPKLETVVTSMHLALLYFLKQNIRKDLILLLTLYLILLNL